MLPCDLMRRKAGDASPTAPSRPARCRTEPGRSTSPEGAKSIALVPADISLLGEPQEIRIRLRGSSRGHPLRLQMVTHFMTFERTLGAVDGDGPHEIVMPAPPAEGWRWFGGENDGKIHGPLRITGLFLDAAGKTEAGQLEMIDIRVTSRCPADRTSVLTAELRAAKPAPQFVGVVRSMASRAFRCQAPLRDPRLGRPDGRQP